MVATAASVGAQGRNLFLELRNALRAINRVASVHDLHVWALTSGVNALSVHVVARASDGNFGELLRHVERCASGEFRIAHVTVQIELPGWHCGDIHE